MRTELGLLVPSPVPLMLGGAEFYVPPCTALDWVTALERDPRTAAFQLLDHADRQMAALRMVEGSVTLKDCERATHKALEAVTGQRWWWVMRMLYLSVAPAYAGEMALAGLHPGEVTLHRWCCAVYRIHTKHASGKDKLRLDFELELPPPGEEDNPWDDDDQYYRAMLDSARKMNQG